MVAEAVNPNASDISANMLASSSEKNVLKRWGRRLSEKDVIEHSQELVYRVNVARRHVSSEKFNGLVSLVGSGG